MDGRKPLVLSSVLSAAAHLSRSTALPLEKGDRLEIIYCTQNRPTSMICLIVKPRDKNQKSGLSIDISRILIWIGCLYDIFRKDELIGTLGDRLEIMRIVSCKRNLRDLFSDCELLSNSSFNKNRQNGIIRSGSAADSTSPNCRNHP